MERVLLLVFDGFGINPGRLNNGWAQARTPHLDGYFAQWPHTVLEASGKAVGLPDCQFGNSEVGHMTLGAGRVLQQDLGRIGRVIGSGALSALPAWRNLVTGIRRLHLLGLVSDGGVHAHIDHLLGILPILQAASIEPVIHMITDGRDAPPRSAGRFVAMIGEALRGKPGRIGTMSGRYYAMDRAGHWDRTRRAWAAIVEGSAPVAATAKDALAQAYARGETDEFIAPTVIGDALSARVAPDERLLDFNFRSDRARQLVAAIGLSAFDAYDRGSAGVRAVTCMTQYDVQFPFPVLFAPDVPQRVLAECLSC
ncbi:MAG: 2,3-bisphosphoglycerate-independent phosphoglycerate mutase, partial [Gammaproteobacteria bacterium]|nr:2,3-bisphosphoglycerate-independent phosphoglycerate mutase [Gammaproteobacteria bacterium]